LSANTLKLLDDGSFFACARCSGLQTSLAAIHEESAMPATDFQQRLNGFGVTTAQIFYHRPDYPAVLQSYLWQRHDLHPHERCGRSGRPRRGEEATER